MTTMLKKPVARKAELAHDKRRRLVITLYPGDLIGLRAERTRTEYVIPIQAVYGIAVRMEIQRKRDEKAKARKARRKT